MYKIKKKKIKNQNYRLFLDEGIIEPITINEITEALGNVKGKYKAMGRSLLIAMYYTGARPNEVLRLHSKDIIKEKSYILVKLKGSKRGLPRTLYFRYNLRHIPELYKYAQALPPNMFLFWFFRNRYTRTSKLKSGKIAQRDETTDKLRYYFNLWFRNVVSGGVTPYFLRHNRFSQLSEAGLTMQDLRMIKGSRSYESINYYIHLSTSSAKKAAKKIK